MMDFENEYYLYLLWAVPVLILLYINFRRKQLKSSADLGDRKLVSKLIPTVAPYTGLVKLALLLLAYIALARAQSFMLGALENLHGEQVAIVVFAGKAESYVPLTTDYNYVKTALKSLSTSLVAKPGTLIRDALKISSVVLQNKNNDARIISVLSDGETPESNFQPLADSIRRSGINLFAFGVGTQAGGTMVEQNQQGVGIVKRDSNGSPIISRLHEDNLLKLVKNQPTRYYNLDDKDGALAMFANELQKLQHNTQTSAIVKKDYFQLFLFIALFLLVTEILIA
jgi:Ca-activated chloride channel family protein